MSDLFKERPEFDLAGDVVCRRELRIGRVWQPGESIPWQQLAVTVHQLEIFWQQGLIDTYPTEESVALREKRLEAQQAEAASELADAQAMLEARQRELAEEQAKTEADSARIVAEAAAVVEAELKKEQEERELADLQARLDALEAAEAPEITVATLVTEIAEPVEPE